MALPTNHPLSEIYVSCHSSSVASTPIVAVVLSPVRGTIKKVTGVINGAITGADCSVAVAIGTTAITGSPFTIANASSAAGTNGSFVPTALNKVIEGDYITFTPSGATGTTVTGNFTLYIEKD